MSKTRGYFTAELKAPIVRRHWSGKGAVCDLADAFGLQPSLIHGGVNQALAQVIFDERDRKLAKARQRRQQARQLARHVA